MRLDVFYDPETDMLSLWNGVAAAEGADVAEGLIADFDGDGEVVGFTLEHAGELLGVDLSHLGGGDDEDDVDDEEYEDASEDVEFSGNTALEKLLNAFPDLYEEKVSAHKFSFWRGASIYVSKAKDGVNTARIHSGRVGNYPNAGQLRRFIERHDIQIHSSNSHPDYMFRLEHVDELIRILRG